jgi:hypothetical protein
MSKSLRLPRAFTLSAVGDAEPEWLENRSRPAEEESEEGERKKAGCVHFPLGTALPCPR